MPRFYQLLIFAVLPSIWGAPTPTLVQSQQSASNTPDISLPSLAASSHTPTDLDLPDHIAFNLLPTSEPVEASKRAGLDDYLWLTSAVHVMTKEIKQGDEDSLATDLTVINKKVITGVNEDRAERKGRTLVMDKARSGRRRRNWRRRSHP
ncbi:uncharacterized protein IL334_005120 [Kwoniella shivajii]|uniref:Uncharacterized protein n=1 Tax=Kwoniella shivajii TaxID=564305 RepID=A0ABZ1D2M6_9TREE|nr:hypothetical protein IL334_005120 [Kwoniella shivajii]